MVLNKGGYQLIDWQGKDVTNGIMTIGHDLLEFMLNPTKPIFFTNFNTSLNMLPPIMLVMFYEAGSTEGKTTYEGTTTNEAFSIIVEEYLDENGEPTGEVVLMMNEN